MLLEPEHDATWYEQRKRALVLGCLMRPYYNRTFEPACGRGRLTSELARRSGSIVAMDLDPRAVESARSATAGCSGVDIQQGNVPNDWPYGHRFDLIVLSEFLYYLPPEQLPGVCASVIDTLAVGGEVIACHWRHPIPESTLAAEKIHELCALTFGLASITTIDDADFLLQVWSRESGSVARLDGIVS